MGKKYPTVTDVYHKITIAGKKSRYSAWFDKCGFLIDCERKDSRNRVYPCSENEIATLQRGPCSARQHIKV